MSEKRDQLIGAKFTSAEKEIIEAFLKKNGLTKSEFIRQAIFSHINHLEDNTVGHINYGLITIHFEEIEEFIQNIIKNSNSISKNINKINNQLNTYDMKRIRSLLQQEARENI